MGSEKGQGRLQTCGTAPSPRAARRCGGLYLGYISAVFGCISAASRAKDVESRGEDLMRRRVVRAQPCAPEGGIGRDAEPCMRVSHAERVE